MVRIAIGFICGVLAALSIGAIVYHCTRPAANEGVHEQTAPGARAQIAEATPAPALENDKPDSFGPDESTPMPDEAAQIAIDSIEAGVLQSLFASDEMREKLDQARAHIEAAFAEFDAANGGAEAESRLVRTLTEMNPTLLLSTVHDMMRTGDAQTRMTALTALSAIYGDPASPAATEMRGIEAAAAETDAADAPPPKETDEDAELDAEIRAKNEQLAKNDDDDGEEAALRIKLLVESVAAGLEGADAGVKEAALETALTLPEEAAGALASQILSGDDDALKRQLLTAIGGASDPSYLQINLQAMSGEDDAARRLAADNLENALGQRFSTVEEATEWIEANITNPSAEADGGAAAD